MALASAAARGANVGSGLRRLRMHWPQALVWLAGGIAALALVLVSHGLLPGYVNNAPSAYLTEGAMRCMHDIGRYALSSYCPAYGQPLGYPLLTNGPAIVAGALLMRLPGVDEAGAYLLVGAIIDALGLWGGFALARRLGADRGIALGIATLYLISTTVVGLEGFVGTFSGFVLLPPYAALDLWMLDRVERTRGRRLALVLGAYAIVRVLALFLDGYSFIVSGLATVCLWAASAWSRRRSQRVWGASLGVIVTANACAVLLYTLYVPGAYAENPIAIFRSMGLDVVTLVAPTNYEWVPNALGLASDHSDLWGDGTNSAYNYVGLFCLVLGIVGLVVRPRRRQVVALAFAGLIALLLALGPSLKVADVHPTQAGLITYQSYLMPSSAAELSLPWSWIYGHVPGIENMRATYRWFGLTRLALILLAGLGVQWLVRRHRVLGGLAACLIALELLPNFGLLTAKYRTQHEQMHALSSTVGGELQQVTQAYDRAFFLNYDGSHNDYLANYLASQATLRAFNAGGDKDAALDMAHWPPEIAQLASAGVNADAVYAALNSGAATVVIAPYFHLRWNAYSWPPTAEQKATARKTFAPILRDPRFTVRHLPWLASIRLAH